MNVKCIPVREMFHDEVQECRILACELLESDVKIELNKHGNFSLSGKNLEELQLDQEANIVISPDSKSKYPGSYIMLGYQGIGFNEGKIEIDPAFEVEILGRLMGMNQARYVNEAYPNFVHMVLNGQEDEIDYHNIFNVGKKRLPDYIDKVKRDCHSILFYPTCYQKGIESQGTISRLAEAYKTPEGLEQEMSIHPYMIYMDVAGYSFDGADRLVKAHYPNMLDSVERCERATIKVLKENEETGDTRLSVRILVEELKELVPETKDHIKEVITNNPLFFYDEERKRVALMATYMAECTIADHIKHRLADKRIAPKMNWRDYTEVDGFTCTEEQSKILQMVADGARIALLTGSAGCGKTSSMRALIRMLEAHGKTYQLLAPTGIAARRLNEATDRPASTIHMALAMGIPKTEYIILEESSMIAVHLLASLLNGIGYNPNLVFICDEAQLASISCGNIVQDIIDSGVMPHANLTKVFRYGTSGLATVATDTRNGKIEHLFDKYPDFKCVESDGSMEQILLEYENLLRQGYKKNDILILSPFNKGDKGTYVINQRIQKEFNNHEYTPVEYKHPLGKIQFKIGDKVLNTKNNYSMPCIHIDEDGYESERKMFCANGDIGIVRDYRKIDDSRNALVVEFDNGMALVSGKDIGHLILGYAVSCHKAQGLGYKAVLVVIAPQHKRMLSRNLCYVALSRAQERMILISDQDTIYEALKIQENLERDTYLADLLKENNDD
jgi:exodeoxyribonuclease V alpha subunit